MLILCYCHRRGVESARGRAIVIAREDLTTLFFLYFGYSMCSVSRSERYVGGGRIYVSILLTLPPLGRLLPTHP